MLRNRYLLPTPAINQTPHRYLLPTPPSDLNGFNNGGFVSPYRDFQMDNIFFSLEKLLRSHHHRTNLTIQLQTGKLFSSARHALTVLDSAFSPAFGTSNLFYEIQMSNMTHIRSLLTRMIAHFDKTIDDCITDLCLSDPSTLSNSLSQVLLNLSRKFKISQSSIVLVEQIVKKLSKPTFLSSKISSKKTFTNVTDLEPLTATLASCIMPLMQLKTKWSGTKPPSITCDYYSSFSSKRDPKLVITNLSTKRANFFNPIVNTKISEIRKKLIEKQIPSTPPVTTIVNHSSTPLSSSVNNLKTPEPSMSLINSPKSDISIEVFCTPRLSLLSPLTVFPTATTVINRLDTTTHPSHITTIEQPVFVSQPTSLTEISVPSSSGVLSSYQRPNKRGPNLSPLDQTPNKIRVTKQVKFLTTPTNSLTFARDKNSTTHWTLPPLTKKVTIIGDSNIARLNNLPDNFLALSYTGANIDNLRSLISNYKDLTHPEHLIFSVGINNRNQNPLCSSIPSLKALISKSKSTFPNTTIHLTTINFSCNLSKKEQDNLGSLNKFLSSVKNCSIIPPLPKSAFVTTADHIHWSSSTANNFLTHLINFLKV